MHRDPNGTLTNESSRTVGDSQLQIAQRPHALCVRRSADQWVDGGIVCTWGACEGGFVDQLSCPTSGRGDLDLMGDCWQVLQEMTVGPCQVFQESRVVSGRFDANRGGILQLCVAVRGRHEHICFLGSADAVFLKGIDARQGILCQKILWIRRGIWKSAKTRRCRGVRLVWAGRSVGSASEGGRFGFSEKNKGRTRRYGPCESAVFQQLFHCRAAVRWNTSACSHGCVICFNRFQAST